MTIEWPQIFEMQIICISHICPLPSNPPTMVRSWFDLFLWVRERGNMLVVAFGTWLSPDPPPVE